MTTIIKKILVTITKKLYLSPIDFFKTIYGNSYFIFNLFLCVLYTTIFNLPIYYIYRSESFFSSEYLIISYFLTTLLNYVVFLCISLIRPLFYISIVVLFVFSSIVAFLVVNFKVKINMNSVALVFETNIHEASGVAGSEMICVVLIAFLLSLVLIFIYRKFIKDIPYKVVIYFVILQTFFINFPIMKFFSFKFRGIPNDLYIYSKQYIGEKKRSIKMSQKRIDLSKKYKFSYKNSDLVVVLIIGEAERGLNYSSNGYERETDPNLKALEAISYKNAYSCGTITRVSIPCMLTRATFGNQDISKKEKSVISIFKSLGFKTFWISNQGVMGEHETPITPVINESDNKIFVNISGAFEDKDVLDENILPVFKRIVSQNLEKAFFVIHLIGSHWYYEHHYTERFRKFTPVCKSKFAQKCTKEELYNSYDNSLLYTDWVVSEIMKMTSNKNAIVFFVSDHGESLGEDNIYTHWVEHTNRIEQRSIAWFVFVSDEYKRRHPNLFERLKENKDKYISHDNLFHSLLDCALIESEIIDKKMSICQHIE
ncbi:MAG: lipid A phosphoethanolamine transferase [Deltaproteobacteria bacterium]|nr:lipid A phosphoethanolamine transferase [Deltaproteobacteria bacterium]